jgi:glucose uptake protein GlcU
MNYLKKTWVRVLVSLFGAGLIIEFIHISTGDPNRQRSSSSFGLLIIAAILFFILTAYSNKNR